jgi:hypothetical protein
MMEWPLVTRDLSGGAEQVADPTHGRCYPEEFSILEGFSSHTVKSLPHARSLRDLP